MTAHGTLYKALGRLEEFGLFTSGWEDVAAVEGRRAGGLYQLTSKRADVAEAARAGRAAGPNPSPASGPA